MSTLTTDDYIKFIISYLKDESKIQESKMKDVKNELELDLLSQSLFGNLYNNLLLYYKLYQKKNIKTDEQKYLFKEILNILEIIYDSNPTTFINSDHIKAVLIYLVNSLKTPLTVNPEIVIKIFLDFKTVFPNITNKIIENELSNFETEAIKIINKLNEIYYMDFNIDLDLTKKINFNEIISYLQAFPKKLPIYFKGFIKYNEETNKSKYLKLKIYNYFNIINHYTEEKDISLYKGYLLYGILSYNDNDNNNQPIDFEAFKSIQEGRTKNEEAKNILTLSIKFLSEKSFNNFLSILEEENFDFNPDTSKVLDIFDETDKYYKELYNQFKYYLSQYKQGLKLSSEIYKKNNLRVLWLNFIKLILLYLSETDIYESNIKIIFYFIVNLFNPEIDSSALEFREDVIQKLFSQNITSTEILFNEIFYKIIDKDYSKYYSISDKMSNFKQTFINMRDKKLTSFLKNRINRLPTGPKEEIKNIQKIVTDLPFPIFQEYLSQIGLNFSKSSCIPQNLNNFYRICFYDLEENEKESFCENIRNIEYPTSIINEDDIKNVLSDESFITLIKDIMKSPVMKDAYTRIFYYYSTKGEFDLDQEDFEQKSFKLKNNYINDKSIFEYYEEFCGILNNLDYAKLFITMSLPESIKAFTFRFLKIVINYEGVRLNNEKSTDDDKGIETDIILLLLRAYLVFIVIHELNHFMKRYLNKNQIYDLCKTPTVKEYKEGGEQLIKLLFGHILIENSINIEQAKFILEPKNWNKKSVIEFRTEFSKIKKDSRKDNCIIYLSSESKSKCDHSKLNG